MHCKALNYIQRFALYFKYNELKFPFPGRFLNFIVNIV